MTVLSDKWIKKMSKEQGMISPFEDKQQKNNVISYWLSSYGYDARVSNEFKIFTNVNSSFVDPKNFFPSGTSKHLLDFQKYKAPEHEEGQKE